MKRRGLMLNEMLIALTLLGTFLVISAKLFTSSIRSMQDARSIEASILRFDNALDRLREDVWSASKITASNNSAVLVQNDGRSVIWRFDDRGTLLRKEIDGHASRETAWNDLRGVAAFSSDGPMLILGMEEERAKIPVEIKMISQLQLARGEKP